MIIKLDLKKYRKRMLFCWGATGILAALLAVSIAQKHEELLGQNPKSMAIVFGMILLLSFFVVLTIRYSRLKQRKEWVMRYENGILEDFSKPFTKALSIQISEIESITHWSERKGMNQYKLVKKTNSSHSKQHAIISQLMGRHIYLTDFVVDSAELQKLALLIERECTRKTK